MISKSTIRVASAVLLAGILSFAVGRLSGGPATAHGNLAQWLSLTPQQQEEIRQADPTYEGDIVGLKTRLATLRRGMAAKLVESGDGRETDVRAQVEEVDKAEDALEQRVMQHLFEMRKHLSPQQAHRLMSLAAQGVLQADKLASLPTCCAAGTCKCSAKTATHASAQDASQAHDAGGLLAHNP